MKTLIIIPAYNEEESIVNTVKTLTQVNNKVDYIVINDGSVDKTKEVCELNNINYVDLPNNLGIGGAVQTGYKYALLNNYDIAIQFDGDGQHDANYISNLIKEIENGANMVIGSRFISDLSEFKSTKLRRVGINLLSNLIKICTNQRIYDPTSGFRAVDKNIISLFAQNYPTDYPEPDTIVTVIKKGYKVKEIPAKMKERTGGKSSISNLKGAYYMLKVSISIIFSSINTKREWENDN